MMHWKDAVKVMFMIGPKNPRLVRPVEPLVGRQRTAFHPE